MASAVATRDDAAITKQPLTEGSAQRLFEPGGVTLEDSILGVWEDLVAQGRAECPVCGESIAPTGGCRTCGSQLS